MDRGDVKSVLSMSMTLNGCEQAERRIERGEQTWHDLSYKHPARKIP